MEASGNPLLIVHLPVQHEHVLCLCAHGGRSSLCIKEHLCHQQLGIGRSSRVRKVTRECQALLAEGLSTGVLTLIACEPCQVEERANCCPPVPGLLIKSKCFLQQGLCAAQIASIPGKRSKYLQGSGTPSRISYFEKERQTFLSQQLCPFIVTLLKGKFPGSHERFR